MKKLTYPLIILLLTQSLYSNILSLPINLISAPIKSVIDYIQYDPIEIERLRVEDFNELLIEINKAIDSKYKIDYYILDNLKNYNYLNEEILKTSLKSFVKIKNDLTSLKYKNSSERKAINSLYRKLLNNNNIFAKGLIKFYNEDTFCGNEKCKVDLKDLLKRNLLKTI